MINSVSSPADDPMSEDEGGIRGRFKGVFYGYWVLLIAVVLHAMGAGEYFYGFSVFYTPILQEFGWSSAVVAGAFSLSRLEGGLEGPIVGWLVDKYGSRRLMFVGVILTALGFFAMTKVDSVLMLYLVYGGLLSIGHNTGFMHAMGALVAQWFFKKRGRAMSIYTMSAGIGGAFIVPLLAKSITLYGWRTTALLCGLSYIVIGLPLTYLVKNKPEDMGLLPDGETPSSLGTETPLDPRTDLESEPDLSARELLRTKTFWTLMLGESFRSFLLGSLVLHQIPYLVSIGIPGETAATILGLMITLSIPGRLIFGSLGDYRSKRLLLVLAMTLQAGGIFIFSQATGVLHAYAFVIIYGIAYGGAIPLLYAFRADLFGRKRFASISGFVSLFKMVGSVVGPIFAGYIFDIYGDYRFAFNVFTVLALLSAVTFYFVRPLKNTNSVTVA
jgi:MFS family permease